MASLITDPNGCKRIGFADRGKSKTVRLGKVPTAVAQLYHDNIEHLIACRGAEHLVSNEVLVWAKKLDDVMYQRLVNAGLLPSRVPVTPNVVTLETFLDDVVASIQVKDSTRTHYGHAHRNLLEYFGAKRDIATIGAKEADAFHG